MKVVKVTKTYFELEDGRQYEHFEILDRVPPLEDFQKMYDKWDKELRPKTEECKYRGEIRCNHPQVKNKIQFELDNDGKCGDCLYREK